MKKLLLTLLAAIIVLGLFGAAGYAGYRFGFAQGVQATTSGDTSRPGLRPFHDFGPRRMPMHNFGFDYGFRHGFGMGGFPMMGFGLFWLFGFLWRIAVVGLILWFLYWLFTRSGWRLTRQTVDPTPTRTETITETKTEKTENE